MSSITAEKPPSRSNPPLEGKGSHTKDIIVTILCLMGALLSFWLFWKDLNRTIDNQNAVPVGYITYKHQAVQRRFGDRVLWQRLSRGTPVYGEDLIRTAELSEATIYLDEGPGIELAENTLIQIRIEDGRTTLHLSEGGVALNVPENMGDSSFVLVAGGKQVELSAGTAISAAAGSGGNLNLQVSGGSVKISGPDGVRELDAGEMYSEAPPDTPLAAALGPRPNTRLFVREGETLRVGFSWTTQAYPAGGRTRLEIAEDRRFNRIVQTMDLPGTEWETGLGSGVYWWRVSPIGAPAGVPGNGDKLTITQVSAPRVISP
ncbi:MAG: FecR family protein, partial [Treponema sp.]|nr:FecR family protein [Treponema sp.]